jgi:hypothetical protein
VSLVLAGLALEIVFLLPVAALLTDRSAHGSVAAVIPIAIIGTLLACFFWLLAVWFPSMRYEIGSRALELRYGPVLHYRIPLKDIERLSRRDLSPSLWASLRLPGIALFTVRYNDVGPVKMCASSAAHGILLIQTVGEAYGITPEREDEFVSMLESRLGH